MKKLLKPEIEFVKFDAQDVITTSGGDDPSKLAKFKSPAIEDDTNGKSLTTDYDNLAWNNITQ